MRRFEEMNREEKKEVVLLFNNWLKDYTHEVIIKVMEKREDIINNDFVMKLLRELKEREEKEADEFKNYIDWLLFDFEAYKEFNPHNHVTTHSNSYRDILYDMYIR